MAFSSLVNMCCQPLCRHLKLVGQLSEDAQCGLGAVAKSFTVGEYDGLVAMDFCVLLCALPAF